MVRKRKKSKSSFRNKVSANSKRQQQQAKSYGYLKLPKDVSIFKETPGGKARLDFIPYEIILSNHPDRNDDDGIAIKGEEWYKRPFKIHRNVGSGNDTIVCPTSIGKKCPICDYRKKRFKEGAEKEETDAMKTNDRNLYLVIPREDKEHEENIHVWDISQYLFQNLLNDEIEENEDNGIFPDIDEGLTVKIRFDAKSIGKNKFAEASRIDFIERENEIEDELLENIPSLDEMLSILSFNELETKFFELEEETKVEEEEEVEDEEEEKPKAKRKSKTKRNPKSKKVEEEEDEEWEDENEKPELEDKEVFEGEDDEEEVEDEEPFEDDEEEDEEEVTKKSKPKLKREKKKEKVSKNKCPYGHKFGIDTDKFEDDCDDCAIWESCIDKKEEDE